MILIRVDVRQLELQFEMFPTEAVIGVARDMDKRYYSAKITSTDHLGKLSLNSSNTLLKRSEDGGRC